MEKAEFVKIEPASEKWFMPWYGSQEFINRCPRWCLWLGNCPPNELRKMPECMKRVEAVRQFRLASPGAGTVKLADKPTHFHVENMPIGTYVVIPEVSSERRRYVPMGFMTPDILCSNLVKIVPNASLYHFGVLTSNVHMAWMRAVCGRLKSDYRYSKDVVYNNFPWPTPTEEQKAKIEQTAVIETLQSKAAKNTLVGSETMYLIDWMEQINNAQSMGVHHEVTREQAMQCIIHTYIALGDILSLKAETGKG